MVAVPRLTLRALAGAVFRSDTACSRNSSGKVRGFGVRAGEVAGRGVAVSAAGAWGLVVFA